MRIRRFVPLVAWLVITLSSRAPALAADALQPSHQCLPDETVVVVRVPEGLKFVEAFRNQTKLGQVLLSTRRFDGIVNLIREQAADGLTQFTEELGKYNLKIEDFPKLFDKDVGYAVVLEPRRDRYPLVVGLGWAEPDSDLGQRLMAAIAQGVDEDKNEPNAARRVDFDVDGTTIMHLTIPEIGPAVMPSLEVDDLQDLDGAELRAKLEERRRKISDAKQIEIDQTHVLLARVGDRLLLANTFPQSESEVRELLGDDADKKLDLAAITGAEEAKGVFARFLKAHTAQPTGLTPRVMATPGLAGALPEGVPLVEVLFSPEPLFRLASQSDSPAVAEALKSLGIDRLGPGAFRMALDRGALRSGLFLSAPEPREGLLALLDQPAFSGDPPAWVPASVLSYAQISFDLGKAYKLLRDVVLKEAGDQAQAVFTQLEQQISAVTQNDVATLLSSVGQNHYFVMFPPTPVKPAEDADDEIETPSNRMGLVWQLKDEAPWKRLIQLGAGFAAATGGAVTAGEEQGFIGLRLSAEGFSGGVFVGHGYMVLGIGNDVLEPIMSAVRTPPEGAAALRGSDLARRAATLLPAEPCIVYTVTDYDRYVKGLREGIMSIFDISSNLRARQLAGTEQPAGEDAKASEDEAKLVARIKELIPSDEELEGTTGVSVGHVIVNQHGITYRGALEMPQ